MNPLTLAIITVFGCDLVQSATLQSCDSLVYCQGDLLHTVQRSKIFDDSKTFVDMIQIHPYSTTLDNFDQLKRQTDRQKIDRQTNGNPTEDDIRKFVDDNFVNEGELESWAPSDYKNNPEILQRIDDNVVRDFARNLVEIWPTLARKVKSDVAENPDRHSLIPVPNGFIIPGGRFRELYYWDSYWIIEGLLISEMQNTVRGMLENLLSFVERYGFIPNGGRVYYLNRSQPPLLTLMVGLYLDETDDTKWLRKYIGLIETELKWWLTNRTVTVEKNGVKYTVAHFGSDSGTPRPESYIEDTTTCAGYEDGNRKEDCYKDIKGGAESGWDFSSRWIFDSQGGINENLTQIQTRRVAPVDLNSYLCKAFELLSEFYLKLGDSNKAIQWKEKSDLWKKTIEQVFYDHQDGIWYDFDITLSKSRKIFYPSNFAPLWTKSYQAMLGPKYGSRAAKYFKNKGGTTYRGGIPTSLKESGEQWDLPNAWPPLQEIVILGLQKSGDSEAAQLAKSLAQRWIDTNVRGYQQNRVMFEKYDAFKSGEHGGGGEYIVQTGFGWTNGVALSLIKQYYTDNSWIRIIRNKVFNKNN